VQNIERAVGAAAVDHAIVELEVAALVEHAIDRALDETRLIERRRDERDPHHM
jgi:hypothetical protein